MHTTRHRVFPYFIWCLNLAEAADGASGPGNVASRQISTAQRVCEI
jgi:hypothetical protein